MKKCKAFQICIAVMILFVIYAACSIWVSYNWLTVNEYDYTTEKTSKDIEIVVLSDLHDHLFGPNNEQLVKKVKEQEPDLILLAGDMLNENSAASAVPCSLICNLKETAPVCAVFGNHEKVYMEKHPELIAEMEAAGAQFLDKEYVDLEIKGMVLRIGGLYDYAFGLNDTAEISPENRLTKEFLQEFQNTDRLKIMVSHRPDSFIFGDASVSWDIDLVVSGHDHGGQVVFPFAGGLYGGDQGWFPEYVHGMSAKDNMAIFVTSGLGSNSQKLPRFNNPPEIAVIHLAQDK